jgi:DNA-binding response OmpR family regulator
LVVDDDLDLNTGFALLLEFEGHSVQTAYTAEAALEKLARNHFDLMIAEYWLPLMKGNELAALVKQQWPDLPIIMVTANFEEIHVDDHPIPGVSCLLDKPFSMDQLREAINWVLDRDAEKPTDDDLGIHWIHGGHRAASDSSEDAPRYSDDF